MEIQEIYNNLKRSRTFITEYADLDSRIWHLQFNAQHYNRRKLFNIIGLAAAVLMALILSSEGSTPAAPIGVILYMAPITYLFFRFGVGNVLDYFKRKRLSKQILPELRKLSAKMNTIADELDSFTILPERYRTIHAVDTIGNYIVNKRADTLKEAINLYEDELHKHNQLRNQQLHIQQNNHIIQQNREMIKAQKITNSRLRWLDI